SREWALQRRTENRFICALCVSRWARPISGLGVSNLSFHPSLRSHAIIECPHFAHAPAGAAGTTELGSLKKFYLPHACVLVLIELLLGLAFHGDPVVTQFGDVRQLHRAPGKHDYANGQKEQFQDRSPGLYQAATDIQPTHFQSLTNFHSYRVKII